jgi:hypothetical protein
MSIKPYDTNVVGLDDRRRRPETKI